MEACFAEFVPHREAPGARAGTSSSKTSIGNFRRQKLLKDSYVNPKRG